MVAVMLSIANLFMLNIFLYLLMPTKMWKVLIFKKESRKASIIWYIFNLTAIIMIYLIYLAVKNHMYK